jgi:pyruvate dehydrogenase E1 component
LFESGFNHFFHAREGLGAGQHRGDLVFFQPHSAPGVYARAFLEGRLSEQDLMHYRQEITAPGAGRAGPVQLPAPLADARLLAVPHRLHGHRPHQQHLPRALHALPHAPQLLNCAGRKVWGVFGDGEMDEPESMSALTLAAREGLDNLVWVVNCNLQRLDGPVRGNGRIIDELERLFAGAGWNVVKLVWGSDWDGLFARDLTGALVRTLQGTVDGQMQTFAAKDGRFNRDNFFGQTPSWPRWPRA